MLIVLTLTAALYMPPTPALQDPSACQTAQACRQLAQEAADRNDFETLHDLAWRAMQKGPKNDTALMLFLARAQSLSGRPLDALVMLDRVVSLGGDVGDVRTSDDFRRVRALPGWADFERRAAGVPPSVAAAADAAPATIPSTVAPPSRESAPPPAAALEAPRTAGAASAEEALRFTTTAFTPAGFAYDRVSNRFIVADRGGRKLTVVDEASQRVANLAGAQSAGFGEISALEIDPREGDLWVVSSDTNAGTSTLHKLQLISGRVLFALPIEAGSGAVGLTDVAVSPHSTVFALDSKGRRIFRVQPRSRRIDPVITIDLDGPVSIAPESDSVLYVATTAGIARADVSTGQVRRLGSAARIDLSGIARLRWHRGALIAVQKTSDGKCQVVRYKVDSNGRRITSADVLDRNLSMSDPTAATMTDDTFFYLAQADGSGGMAMDSIVRRITLR